MRSAATMPTHTFYAATSCKSCGCARALLPCRTSDAPMRCMLQAPLHAHSHQAQSSLQKYSVDDFRAEIRGLQTSTSQWYLSMLREPPDFDASGSDSDTQSAQAASPSGPDGVARDLSGRDSQSGTPQQVRCGSARVLQVLCSCREQHIRPMALSGPRTATTTRPSPLSAYADRGMHAGRQPAGQL